MTHLEDIRKTVVGASERPKKAATKKEKKTDVMKGDSEWDKEKQTEASASCQRARPLIGAGGGCAGRCIC